MGAAVFVEIAGTEYEGRDFAWESNILQLADQWSVTIPAPAGRVLNRAGVEVAVRSAFACGALVRFYVADDEVQGGKRVLKLTGRLVEIRVEQDVSSGCRALLAGYDLGWHLTTGHARVFTNIRGVRWQKFLEKNVLDPTLGWGFAGVRGGNLLNKRTRIGARAAANAELQADQNPGFVAHFQIDVGQALAPVLIDAAKRERYLLNVSADGWLQFFRPDDAGPPLYSFHHHEAGDARSSLNNVKGPKLRLSAEGLYTRVECWTSVVIPPPDTDTFDPNAGRYRGTATAPKALPFARRHTFSDPDQLGQAKANARARWALERYEFDSYEYSFVTAGLNQEGVPYEPDTVCEIDDSVFGVRGPHYISAVRYSRKLARPGGDRSPDAGTTCAITCRLPGLLGA